MHRFSCINHVSIYKLSMYTTLKKLIVNILPRPALLKSEQFFRFILSVFYLGKKVHCLVCENSFSRFIEHGEDLMCPRCGSLARQRRLWSFIEHENIIQPTDKILHFSPARVLQKMFRRLYPCYITSDFANEFPADKHYDITQISASDSSFDIIVCYHVLEHIPDDKKAMHELYRTVKTGGSVIIQTPFKEGAIYEDSTINTPELREEHFGQQDHVRIYSAEGLKVRLENVGFKVKVHSFPSPDNAKFGLNSDERLLVCSK